MICMMSTPYPFGSSNLFGSSVWAAHVGRDLWIRADIFLGERSIGFQWHFDFRWRHERRIGCHFEWRRALVDCDHRRRSSLLHHFRQHCLLLLCGRLHAWIFSGPRHSDGGAASGGAGSRLSGGSGSCRYLSDVVGRSRATSRLRQG